jgi:HSP20 family molecular chaperone IbpA
MAILGRDELPGIAWRSAKFPTFQKMGAGFGPARYRKKASDGEKERFEEQKVKRMQEQVKQQRIPVNMYSTNGRLIVTVPMPGLEPENITIEVTDDGRLILQGALRGMLKEHDGKQRFLYEWHIGAYAREVACSILPIWRRASTMCRQSTGP